MPDSTALPQPRLAVQPIKVKRDSDLRRNAKWNVPVAKAPELVAKAEMPKLRRNGRSMARRLRKERHLLERHAIDVLVCKASGGAATEAKLIAARELSLPVIMVRRPPAEPGPSVETVEAALDWLGELDRAPQAKRMS